MGLKKLELAMLKKTHGENAPRIGSEFMRDAHPAVIPQTVDVDIRLLFRLRPAGLRTTQLRVQTQEAILIASG